MSASLQSLFDLTGRVALVTGGSRGLGFQIAEALGEYGAEVILAARQQKDLDEAVEILGRQGVKAHAIAANLSDEAAISGLVAEILERCGRIDILVNNAGASWGAPAETYPTEGWNKVFALNVSGLFFVTREVANRAFVPAGRGVVLNVASIEGLSGHHPKRIGTIAYNSAKGAVVNMTRALAAEWGPRNIRVNALAPGYFPSKLTTVLLAEHGEDLVAETPLGKLGGDHDLKGAALLMASDAGGHITGQILAIDGGALVV